MRCNDSILATGGQDEAATSTHSAEQPGHRDRQ
jgi:hypothetical protein